MQSYHVKVGANDVVFAMLSSCPSVLHFSRQESQSRGSDETLSPPRSPEGKLYKAKNVENTQIELYPHMYSNT